MELMAGYKQTEVGVIPDDWDAVFLGQLCSFRTGPFGSALHKSDYTTDGIPLINPMHIVDGELVPNSSMTITAESARKLSDFLLRKGDIVIGRRGDMGRCAVVGATEDGWLCGTGSMIVRTGPHADPAFLQRILSSPAVIAKIEDSSVGSTMINLNQGTLRGILVQAPPFPEQRAIAAALTDVDALIAALDALIAKNRDIQQAAMQQLLTGKTRMPGFSGVWRKAQFGDIAKIRNEKVDTFGSHQAEFCLELEQIEQDTGRIEGFTDARSRISSKYHFRKNDVLFGRLRPYLRKFWIADRDGVCSTEIWPLIPIGDAVSAEYLFQYVRTNAFIDAASNAYGTHMPRADWTVLNRFVLDLPIDPEEQTAIASVLSDMDVEVEALKPNATRSAR